jgi:tetratricopeptide (TPR) repeat protein
LTVFEEKRAPESNIAVALNGLGLVRNSQRRYAEAISYFERALEIFEKVHGPGFADCATVLRNIASAFRGLGDSRKEAEALERARRIHAY